MAPHTRKTEFNTLTSGAEPPNRRNSVEFDPAEFLHFLEGTDWSDAEKAEYATLVWNIVYEFVSMGLGAHPIQQAQEACGQPVSSGTQPTLEGVPVVSSSHSNLIEKYVRLNGVESVSDGEGAIDG